MIYEIVLGLEIHLQLNTVIKMFCSCGNKPFGSEPNTHVCPVCLGLPGALPVPNKEAIEKSQLMAYSLGSKLRDEIIFERKNYFYPDLPKGYQITTPHYPISEGGKYEMLFPLDNCHFEGDQRPKNLYGSFTMSQRLPFGAQDDNKKTPADNSTNQSNIYVKWREIHFEEDTAKSIHKDGKTWIDFNKSGVPLLEMVTEPDFHSIDQAVQFAKEIQWYARYLNISDADMEKGNMRLEANISLREIQNPKLENRNLPDYRVELKNINSFTFMKKALEAEIIRQKNALDNGEKLIQETRGYNENSKKTFSQRGKEDAHDYRYFPDPDIPLVKIKNQSSKINAIYRSYTGLSRMVGIKQFRGVHTRTFSSTKGITPRDYLIKLKNENIKDTYLPVIIADKMLASFTLTAIEIGRRQSISADIIVGEIVNKKLDPRNSNPDKLIEFIRQSKSKIVTDNSQLIKWAEKAIKENPEAVNAVKCGKIQAIGLLIGSVMKYSKGKAEAKTVQQIISEIINNN